MPTPRDRELLFRLGARFKRIRLVAGKTQEEVAEVLGIQNTTVSRVECGRTGLSLPLLARAADYFGIGLGELMAIEKDEVPEVGVSERVLLEAWSKLDKRQKDAILMVIDEMGEPKPQ